MRWDEFRFSQPVKRANIRKIYKKINNKIIMNYTKILPVLFQKDVIRFSNH